MKEQAVGRRASRADAHRGGAGGAAGAGGGEGASDVQGGSGCAAAPRARSAAVRQRCDSPCELQGAGGPLLLRGPQKRGGGGEDLATWRAITRLANEGPRAAGVPQFQTHPGLLCWLFVQEICLVRKGFGTPVSQIRICSCVHRLFNPWSRGITGCRQRERWRRWRSVESGLGKLMGGVVELEVVG